MSDLTLILQKMERGDPQAADQLMPLVYDELRKIAAGQMARESAGQTLQPTALVHEAWLRLGGNDQPTWQNRAHFFGAAATDNDDQLLAVHEALDKLAAQDPLKAQLVKLRYFAGMTIEEAALALGISEPTVKRWWTYARTWLYRELRAQDVVRPNIRAGPG
jgi:DNA-directed RNA polymerase specialized sigma24 family protein